MDVVTAGIIATIGIFVFLVCREIVCWYFKINERNSLLRDNNTLLKMQIKQMETLHPELKGVVNYTLQEESVVKPAEEFQPALIRKD